MLPDFPKLKEKCDEALVKLMRALSKKDGLIALIPVGRDFEGDKMSNGMVDGTIRDSEYKTIQSETSIPTDELIEKGFLAHVESAQKVAEDMQRQQVQMIFKQLEEATKATGNVVDNNGGPFTHDTFLKAIETVWIDFSDDGQPYMPSLVVHPTLGNKLKELIPKWEADPALKARLDAVLAKKKKEWDDRESDRKLVD